MRLQELNHFMNGAVPGVVEGDNAARIEKLVAVKEVEQAIVESVPAVDVGEINFLPAAKDHREREIVEVLDELVVMRVARALDVQAADAVVALGLAGVEGNELAGAAVI